GVGLDGGVAAAHPVRQLRQRELAGLCGVIGDNARSRRACDRPGPGGRREASGHPSRLVPRRAVLLVSGRTLLVETDETEAWDGREYRRPAAQDDVGLAPPNAPPLLRPLQLCELAVQDGDRCTQPGPHQLEQLMRVRIRRSEEQVNEVLLLRLLST